MFVLCIKIERMQKEFDMLKRNKENEMANLLRREEKLVNDNKRLRTELQVQLMLYVMVLNRDDIISNGFDAGMREIIVWQGHLYVYQQQYST